MREHRPPERIAPVKFASIQASFSGTLPVAHFERLKPLLASDSGVVQCQMRGELDEVKRPLLIAHVSADLQLLCQTCLTEMTFQIDHDFTLCVVSDEEQAEQITEYDAVIADDEELSVLPLFEDELILSLPVVAHHAPGECAVAESLLREDDEIEASEKPNPFSVLASLKKSSK